MTNRIRAAACAAVVSMLSAAAAVTYAQDQSPAPQHGQQQQQQKQQAQHAQQGQNMSVEQITADWKDGPKKAAQKMVEKYGQPTGVTPARLIWWDKQPFIEIILINEEIDHNFPKPHKDYLEHAVAYDVPVEKVGELAKFDGSILVDRTRGTLSARCDSEAHNLMALNLADDVIKGKKSVEEARQAYAEAAKQQMSGQMPEIAKSLQFQPAQSTAQAGDPDRAIIGQPGGEARQAGGQEPPLGQQEAQQQEAQPGGQQPQPQQK